MNIGVYRIYNTTNNKCYIGSTAKMFNVSRRAIYNIKLDKTWVGV